MYGHTCYIELSAQIGNEFVKESLYPPLDNIKRNKKHSLIPLLMVLISVSVITIILMISCFLFNQMQRRNKLSENMDLDLIKSISNRSVLEAIDELTKDEKMEIDRDNIKILEKLGEGAFGYVRKGIVIKDDVKLEVAVKMLKSK